MYKTATMFGEEHRSRTLLNLLRSFFHSLAFENVPPVFCPFLHVFIFAFFFFFDIFPLFSDAPAHQGDSPRFDVNRKSTERAFSKSCGRRLSMSNISLNEIETANSNVTTAEAKV